MQTATARARQPTWERTAQGYTPPPRPPERVSAGGEARTETAAAPGAKECKGPGRKTDAVPVAITAAGYRFPAVRVSHRRSSTGRLKESHRPLHLLRRRSPAWRR